MSKVVDIRRRTAEKMAKPAREQKPLLSCRMPAHIRSRLETIRVECELRVAERKALEAEPANRQEDQEQ